MIEPYSHEKHFAAVAGWLKQRGMILENSEMFSDSGFVVDKNAVGFLYKTNSKQCWLANVVANPEASKEERDEALNTLIRHIETVARKDGFKFISTMAHLPAMQMRFITLDFSIFGQVISFFKHL